MLNERPRLRLRPFCIGSAGAGQAFHHQARAAARDMGDDGRAAVDLRYHAKIDGKGQLNGRALLQAHVIGFDEYAIGAEIHCAAQFAGAPWHRDEYDGSCLVSVVESSLHGGLALL